MKIKLITLHRVVNYGSVLQAYATQRFLQGMGHEVEVIDYYPERLHMLGMLKRIKDKGEKFKKSFVIRNMARLIVLPSYLKRFPVFFSFIKRELNLSPVVYESEESFDNYLDNADVYLTGSDQVWNCGWNEKIDHPYYLSFAPDNKKKVAYAASFGKSKLDDWEIDETRDLLQKYHAISLREKSGVDIVSDLGIDGATHVVDPTLLLNGDEWRNISSGKFKNERYILIYNLNRNKKIDNYAKNLSKKTGLKIKYLSYQFHEFYKAGKMYCNPKVEDFLALIDNAEFVITDSFHATAFSLNFNTQFIIVYPEKYSTRLQSVLELTGLTDRIAKKENDMSVSDRVIDFSKVNQIIENERIKSKRWLINSIEVNES